MREAWRALRRRVCLSEVVSEFEPKPGPRRRDSEIILGTRALTVFSVSFHVSILSSNGPLKAEKLMACVVVICSSIRAIYLRGTDAVATRSLQTRRPSYDHEDGVDAKFNFAQC